MPQVLYIQRMRILEKRRLAIENSFVCLLEGARLLLVHENSLVMRT